MKLESKIVKSETADKEIFEFLTDFKRIQALIPTDKVDNWESGDDWCTFEVSPVGKTGIKIIEKQAFKLVKYANVEQSQYNFNFWAQLKHVSEGDTRIKLTIDVSINPMLQMMVKKPLKEFLDKLAEQLAALQY